jgi:protein phosphatase
LNHPVVRYAAAAVTDVGRKRSTNQDTYGLSAEHGVYLVCDGMGGAAAGDVASAITAEEMLRLLCGRDKAAAAPLEIVLSEAIRAANQAIYSRALRNPRLFGMGTTLVGLVTEGRRVVVFNVGDSRCYRLRAPGPQQSEPEPRLLEQITLDHSLVAEQVRMGRMSRDQAQISPLHNVITRALGTEPDVEPDFFPLEAEAGDLFLLCSDGLTNELDDARIASILAVDLPLDKLCANLVAAANQAGGRDNITCLLVRAQS